MDMKLASVLTFLFLLLSTQALAQQIANPSQTETPQLGQRTVDDSNNGDETPAPASTENTLQTTEEEPTEQEIISDPELLPPPEEIITEPEELGTEEDQTTAGPKKVSIDTVIHVDYQFFDSTDAFKVKYHINMGGNANLATSLIKGNAEIATEVTGYLSKWATGQCVLDVSIAKTPYEIKYSQSENQADISIMFKKEISETWESTCTFVGGSKPFKTQGPPEKWIEDALKRASPPLGSVEAPLEKGEASTTTFTIPEYTVIEEGLGSAKVKGTGVITIQPAGKKGPQSKEEPTSSIIKPQTPQPTPTGPITRPPLPTRLPFTSAQRTQIR